MGNGRRFRQGDASFSCPGQVERLQEALNKLQGAWLFNLDTQSQKGRGRRDVALKAEQRRGTETG
jgi:hypothetical protein